MKKRRFGGILIAAVCLYGLLLVILVISENTAGDGAQIRGFGDAFWYSLITLTTVGYGDMVPVTPAGRLAGSVFSLMSLGILALLVSILVSIFRDDIFPDLLLYRNRGRRWAIFAGEGTNVEKAAANTLKAWPDAVMIMTGQAGPSAGRKEERIIRTSRGAEEILAYRTGRGRVSRSGNDVLFILGDSDARNVEQAISADRFVLEKQADCDICCRVRAGKAFLPESIRCFDEEEITARLFWMRYGLRKDEKRIVIIGPQGAAEILLEYGLSINVRAPGQAVTYDLFCGSPDFLKIHGCLGGIRGSRDGSLTARLSDESGDTVIAHTGSWRAFPEILRQAERIVLCDPDSAANLAVLDCLLITLGIQCPIYVRMADSTEKTVPDGVTVFGTTDTVYTPDMMLNDRINSAARALHEIYRASSGREIPDFDSLSRFAKGSNIAAADHLVTKLRILLDRDDICAVTVKDCMEAASVWEKASQRENTLTRFLWIEHIRWVRFHLLYNWTYAQVRREEQRQHPMLLPFGRLDPDEQKKDAHAWEMIGKLAHAAESNNGDKED